MSNVRLHPSISHDFRVMAIGIIAVAFTVIVWIVGSGYNHQSAESLKNIDADALRVERHMLLTLDNTSYVLESLGRQIIRTQAYNQLQAIHGLLESFGSSTERSRHVLSWINDDQKLVVSNYGGGILNFGVDVSDRDYVKKAVAEPWRIHIGRPVQGRVSGKWVLPMSMGITNNEADFIGVVLMALDVPLLTRQLEETLQTYGLHVAVTNRAFTLILEADNSPIDFTNQTAVSDLIQLNFTQTRRHIISRPSITHPDRYLRVIDAPNSLPLRLFFTMHPNAYQDALMAHILPRIAEVLLITGFLLFLLWSLRKRVVKPVHILTRHTSNVVRATDQTIPEISAPIEVQELRHEIQQLCLYLQERTHVANELRSKLDQQNTLAEHSKAQHRNYQGMATGFLQDIAVLAQHDSREARKAMLSLLREMRPLFDHKGVDILQEKSCDTGLLIKRAIADFAEQETVHADITLDSRASLIWLNCDEAKISHMLTQLFRYEAEQIPQNPHLDITASIRNGAWWLTISRKSTEHDAPSAAIGIALARAVLAMHEGTVEYQHNSGGKRSITLRFPAERMSK